MPSDPLRILILEFGRGLPHSKALQSILRAATGPGPIVISVIEYPGKLTSAIQNAWTCVRFDACIIVAERITEAVRRFITTDAECARAPVIVMAGETSQTEILDLFKAGIADFMPPPPSPQNVLSCLCRLVRQSETERAGHHLKQGLGLARLVGTSPKFLAEVNKISLAAKCDVTVLIGGETGTGKELFARAIHYLSRRQGGPFTPVNCGAIPPDLVENELFGHRAGAFTGATAERAGMIEESGRGTLFLDEIDCLPAAAQVKLLRVLQEKEYRPLGSTKTLTADIRVISATNADVAESIQSGRLRRDLYYRLNVFPILLPPLRERREDITILARHFLATHSAALSIDVQDFAAGALDMLTYYDWPGNVRELEHAVERALVLSEGGLIRTEHFSIASDGKPTPSSFRDAKARMVAQFEKSYLLDVLAVHKGNISGAARAAKKNRRAFFELMRKHGIQTERFRDAGEQHPAGMRARAGG